MKFTIETDALASALRIASVAVMGARSTLPILGNIKIEATGEQITLSTTNLDIYVIQKLAAKVEKEGATTAPFSILSALVGRMQASKIAIALTKDGLVFKSGDFTAALETLDASEFPAPVPTTGNGVECEATDILKPFGMLAHAMTTQESRYVLMGINIAPKGEFVASDGRRIAVYAGKELTEQSVIVPDVFVRALLKIEPSGSVKVFIENGHITLAFEEIRMTSKLIKGNYPNWRVNVPKKTDKALSCGRKQLIHALQTCSIFCHAKTPGLNLSGKGKEIEVSQPGKASERILGTELEGQPEITIRFNEAFLIAVLDVLDGENVRIQVSDGSAPAIIEEGNFKEIIAPMLIQ